jgi:hypothetical protein
MGIVRDLIEPAEVRRKVEDPKALKIVVTLLQDLKLLNVLLKKKW